MTAARKKNDNWPI